MSTRKMLRAALIAAVYVALCLLLAPAAYGPVQVRVAEALALLPVLCPEAVAGLAVGCFFANLLGGMPLDMLVGTAATLLAAVCTRQLRHVRWRGLPLAAAVPPILFNAVFIGAELSFLLLPAGTGAGLWLLNMATVGAGQLISCGVLGVALVWFIEKRPALLRLFDETPTLPPVYEGPYRLVLPAWAHKREYLAALAQPGPADEDWLPLAARRDGRSYGAVLRGMQRLRTNPPEGLMPSTLFFFMDDADHLLGFLDVRHRLNEELSRVGGHIGYGLVPSARGQHLAPVMLRLGLQQARRLGLGRVLITCNKTNLPSAATIRRCGGTLTGEYTRPDGTVTQQYWVEL